MKLCIHCQIPLFPWKPQLCPQCFTKLIQTPKDSVLPVNYPWHTPIWSGFTQQIRCYRWTESNGPLWKTVKFYPNSGLIRNLLDAYHSQHSIQFHERTVWIPIPARPERVRETGNSIPHMMAEALSRSFNQMTDDSILTLAKTGRTGPTHSKGQMERRTEVIPFQIVRQNKLKNTDSIILVDDFETTGSTLRQAANAFRRAVPEIRIATWAMARREIQDSNERSLSSGSARSSESRGSFHNLQK